MYSGLRSIWPLSSAGSGHLAGAEADAVAIDGVARVLEDLGVGLGHDRGFVEPVTDPILTVGLLLPPPVEQAPTTSTSIDAPRASMRENRMGLLLLCARRQARRCARTLPRDP